MPRKPQFETLEPRRLLAVTVEEQWFVYELNRARHDPAAYQTERQLAVDLTEVAPRPPLAISQALAAAAGFRAGEMAQADYFAHQSDVTGDWPNRIARDHGYPLPSAWPDDDNYLESIAAGTTYELPETVLDALIEDRGDPTGAHRRHLLGVDQVYDDAREIGVGHAFDAQAAFGHYWAVHIARRDAPQTFLTGVVYDDANANRRYDPGEGLAGASVRFGQTETATNAAGGWSLPVAVIGSGTLLASHNDWQAAANLAMSGDNREVDVIRGQRGGFVDFDRQATSAWTNPVNRLDVSGETVVSALDALQVINRLNEVGSGLLPVMPSAAQAVPPFLDVNGDGVAAPSDVLQVINYLNVRPAAGEGEPADPGFSVLSSQPDQPSRPLQRREPVRQDSLESPLQAADKTVGRSRHPEATVLRQSSLRRDFKDDHETAPGADVVPGIHDCLAAGLGGGRLPARVL